MNVLELHKKQWTVIGHYVSSGQPFVEWVEADDATQAAVTFAKAKSEQADDVVIIDVFRGHHESAFSGGKIVTGAAILREQDAKDSEKEAQEAP